MPALDLGVLRCYQEPTSRARHSFRGLGGLSGSTASIPAIRDCGLQLVIVRRQEEQRLFCATSERLAHQASHANMQDPRQTTVRACNMQRPTLFAGLPASRLWPWPSTKC